MLGKLDSCPIRLCFIKMLRKLLWPATWPQFLSVSMPMPLALVTLGFVVGSSFRYAPVVEAAVPTYTPSLAHGQSPSSSSDEAQSGDPHAPASHHHDTLEIPTGEPVPTVQLVVHPDAVQGWNLAIQTTHFRFAPELINQANQPGTGHGHLYLNGEKQGRVYGDWLHLADLAPGHHEITVSLHANGHEALTHNGQPIAATVVIEVPE